MIIFGYPCIGKSTIARNKLNDSTPPIIDLESSCMRRGELNIRDGLWWESYGNIAIDLHTQGFIVLCSSHAQVREYIKGKAGHTKGLRKDDIAVCYPTVMQGDWIEKLQDRYTINPSKKNENALDFAMRNYTSSIKELRSDDSINRIELFDVNYNLILAIQYYIECMGKSSKYFDTKLDNNSKCVVCARKGRK